MSILKKKSLLPILPLRDVVVLPGMMIPLFVGRAKSVAALEEVVKNQGDLILVTQKDSEQDEPTSENIYKIGVSARVVQLLRLPDGTVKVLVEARHRTKIKSFSKNQKYFEAQVEFLKEEKGDAKRIEALIRSIIKSFEQYAQLNKRVQVEFLNEFVQITQPVPLINSVCSQLELKIEEKQNILEANSIEGRLEEVLSMLEQEISILNAETQLRDRVRSQIDRNQREYYLNEQMKAIKKELNDNEEEDEVTEIEKRIKKVKLSKEAKEHAKAELKKLKGMNSISSEANVIRNYLDWILGIPWQKNSNLKHDIQQAVKILDQDHSSLEKVKERIVEHLAVQEKTKSLKGPILCFVGPPGVGKTSLAKSIAGSTGRNFVRMSLGGVRDESEIRGHRRTYIGAMPGKIIQSMKKAKSSNPLFLLDEIDKMGNDFRGDPSSALLEVLDPEQNNSFNDHYLEVDYDLSNVMFIATANTLNMPRPLLDRMEIIHISGYTEDEKVEIAKKHLVKKQLKKHGLNSKELKIADAAIRRLISAYTRESGVRNLEREIAKIARKTVTEIVKEEKKVVSVTKQNLKKYSGIEKFEYGVIDKDDHVGVTTGLAYTEVGGDILPIEAVIIPGGSGKITLTGKLGDVMQESAQAAWSYVRSRCYDFGIRKNLYKKNDVHIHVPEGAIPKDGPSAGAAMCTSIISVLTKIPVKKDVAMTGEISLRGMILPIGGLKEKLLAALRSGIKTAIIPDKNLKDLEEIPDRVKKGLQIIPVSKIDEVLAHALTDPIVPMEWEDIEADIIPAKVEPDNDGKMVKH